MASWSGSWNRFKKKYIHGKTASIQERRVWLVVLCHGGILAVDGNWLSNVLNCRETGGNEDGNST